MDIIQTMNIIFSAVFLFQAKLCLTDTTTGVSQVQLNSLASGVHISAKVLDNLKNSAVSHTAKIELHNVGGQVVPQAGWKLFFHSTYLLLPTIFPKTLSSLLEVEKVIVSMHGGDLYSLEPATNFKPISPGETRMIEIDTAVWSISETDFMPNWYFVSTSPGVDPRVASTTKAMSLDFVKPFDDVRQWKRYTFDRYNPFTPQDRMKRLYVRDTANIDKPVIPTPRSISVINVGAAITIDASWKIIKLTGSTATVADYARRELKMQISTTTGPKTVRLSVAQPQGNANTAKQGYDLTVDPASQVIRIVGRGSAGLFYGVQSLISLIATYPNGLPQVTITDEPRFEYRGMHVDVARNFHSISDLKRLMDAMAMYKMNMLHLHLSDDEGWRLQIPDLPELTSVGSKRCHDLDEMTCIIPQWGSGPSIYSSGSGHYTTNEYKDLLRYANERFIEVVPEFDMPGHAHAAIKAMEVRYNTTFDRIAAEEYRLIDPDDSSFYISVQQWMDNAVNPCIESTYNFIEKVLDTVIELHRGIQPLKTYHFGGDEVAGGAWENSTKCKQFLQHNQQYNVPKGLKKYFAVRVANLTATKGLGLRGWEDGFMDADGNPFPLNDLMNDDVSANPWDNIWEWGASQRAYRFANAGYKVVMSQATDVYFDHPYEPDPKERGFYWATRFTDTRKTFGFLPDSLYDNVDVERSGKPLTKEDDRVCGADLSKCDVLRNPQNVIGMQGHLWSETVRESKDFDYMIFPRLLALAERAWHKADFEEDGISIGERKRREDLEWEKFANTLGHKELKRLDEMNILYRVPPPGARVINGKVEFSVTFPGLSVDFSTDNGTTWNELIRDDNDDWGDRTGMHLRSRSGTRTSRVVELLKDEPLPWADQDLIDYIGENITIQAGVIDNLNKDNDYSSMRLILRNDGYLDIQRGTWKIYFSDLYGVRQEDLDCGLSLVHVNGDLYYVGPTHLFSDIKSGQSLTCTWHHRHWSVAKSDLFPNWYVSSVGMIPRVIANTNETLDYVLPFDSPNKWKRTNEDLYNPFTTHDRYEMHRTKFAGPTDKIIPTPSDIIHHEEADIDLDGWVVVESQDFPNEAKYLSDKLRLSKVNTAPPRRYIYLRKYSVPESSQETYQLDIQAETILIQAEGRPGTFYGVQSLISLWETGNGLVPSWRIDDKPRFSYRGIMIDTARNFKPKEWMFKLLDAMAMYKLNKLHFHLSDNEAWRLEIPGLPELTEMGSNRCQNQDRDLCLSPQRGSGPDKSPPGSGFYTAEDYQEILKYAADRHITVIPEIDMPGHSRAAITAMEYRNAKLQRLQRQGSDTSNVQTYHLFDTYTGGDLNSIHNEDGQMNPCLNSTFEFISKVIDELIVMHGRDQPLEILHIGGDEVYEDAWQDSPACQRAHQTINTVILKQEFMKRVADIVADKGLDMAAWEDGLYANDRPVPITDFKESNVYPYTWSNNWEAGRGKRPAQFADEGYKVILSLGTRLYLDHPYEPDPEEIGMYWATRYIDTNRVFNFMPDDIFANADVNKMGQPLDLDVLCQNNGCPKPTKPNNIIGIQGTMFSDEIQTEEQMHYALFPRLLAVAERAWHKDSWENLTDNARREHEQRLAWEKFAAKLGHLELPRLDGQHFNYRVPPPGAIIEGDMLKVNTLYPNHDVQMSTDGGRTWSLITNDRQLPPGNIQIHLRTISKVKHRPSRVVTLSRKTVSSGASKESLNIVILTFISFSSILFQML